MIGSILSWLAGGGIAAIGKELNRAYQAKLDAKNSAERIDAEKQIAVLEARQAVLIAEQGSWRTSWIRPVIAAPFAVFIWKIVVWDKVLGWGTADALSENMTWVMTVVIGAYFLTRPLEKR